MPRYIKGVVRPYTSVAAAIDDHQGACAEMSAVFVALCRAAGIPARLVSVPDHNWAEFYLIDSAAKGTGFRPTRLAISGSAGPGLTNW